MRIPRDKLRLGAGEIGVVSLKCCPERIGSLVKSPGVCPACRVNRTRRLAAAPNGTLPSLARQTLTDVSFALATRMPKGAGVRGLPAAEMHAAPKPIFGAPRSYPFSTRPKPNRARRGLPIGIFANPQEVTKWDSFELSQVL